MQRRQLLSSLCVLPLALARIAQAQASGPFRFESIDGGFHDLSAWHGQPVLVVNTASLCGFTPQYEALQRLHEAYGPRGLVVLAVPSDDFAQEFGTDAEVAAFCEVTFGLTLPMTTITPVTGPNAHPFYAWMREAHGFAPVWNFNKVLLNGAGQPVATFGSRADPMGPRIRRQIDRLLQG